MAKKAGFVSFSINLVSLLLLSFTLHLISTRELTEESFEEIVGKDSHLFINFHSPSCPRCIALKETWTSLTNLVNSRIPEKGAEPELIIASVDCSKEKELCYKELSGTSKEHAQFPTLKIFRAKDRQGTEYEGPRELPTLLEFLDKQLGLEITKLYAQLQTKNKKDPHHGFGDTTNEDEAREGDDLDRPLNREDDILIPQPTSGLYELSDENYEPFLSRGRHFVKFFAPWCGHCVRLEPTWIQLADSFKYDKSVKISRMNCDDYKSVCSDTFAIKGYPTLLWIVDGKVLEKYSGPRTATDLKTFVSSKIEEDKYSSDTPVRSEDIVPTLTDSTFKRGISKGLSLVVFTAPWCTQCKRLMPIIDDVAIKLSSSADHKSDVQIGKVDCGEFDDLCNEKGVDGYPTIILYRDGIEVTEYEFDGDASNMLQGIFDFVQKHLNRSQTGKQEL